MYLSKLISLYKKAVESDPWVPDLIKSQLEKIPKIEKDPRLINFREKIIADFNSASLSEEENLFAEDYIFNLTELNNILNELLNFTFLNKSQINSLNSWIGLINEIINQYNKNNTEIFITNKITFNGQNYSLTRVYKNVYETARRALDESEKMFAKNEQLSIYENQQKVLKNKLSKIKNSHSNLRNAKDWELRPIEERFAIAKGQPYYVVFTTDYKDIYGMSSKSDWGSCQSLFPDAEGKLSRYVEQVIGSCVSKNVAMIYISGGMDYKGRGEQILYRCMVWIVKDITKQEDVLMLQKMYPSRNENIEKIFKEQLEKHIGMNVVSYSLGKKYIDQNIRKYVETLETPHKPYDDAQIKELIEIATLKNEAKKLQYTFSIDQIISIMNKLQQSDWMNLSDIEKKYKAEDIKKNIEKNLVDYIGYLLDKNHEGKYFKFFIDALQEVGVEDPHKIAERFIEEIDDVGDEYIGHHNIGSLLQMKAKDDIEKAFLKEISIYNLKVGDLVEI